MLLRFPIFFICTFCTFCTFCAFQAFCQDAQQLKQKGKSYLDQSFYLNAIDAFESAKKLSPEDSEIQYLLGIAHYNNETPNLAEKEILPLLKLKKIPDKKLFYYLGKACHAQHEFKEAVRFYKEFLKCYDKNDALRKEVKADILRCSVGLRSMINQNRVVVENLGEIVNSEFDEFAPIVSPNDANRLYFTSNRSPGKSDTSKASESLFSNLNVFYSQIENGKRTIPKSVNDTLKSIPNLMLLDFDETGEKMFLAQGDLPFSGGYFSAVKSGDNFIFNDLKAPINYFFGHRTPYFFDNETVVFAVINRTHQDFDLCIINFHNGQWSEPKNFGESINSRYNETCPFLTNDGKTLYFSSDNPRKGMGGYDIFKSEFDEKTQTWSEPENLNYPINSAGNDLNFRISKDGYSAYFSSDRMTGLGGKDLYSVHFSSSERAKNTEELPQSESELRSTKGLVYKIEIEEINSEKIEKLRSDFPVSNIEELPNSNVIRITFGQYRTFQSANLLKRDLIRKGYAKTVIKAHIDEKEIDKKNAEKLISKYPDLRFFLRKNK